MESLNSRVGIISHNYGSHPFGLKMRWNCTINGCQGYPPLLYLIPAGSKSHEINVYTLNAPFVKNLECIKLPVYLVTFARALMMMMYFISQSLFGD